MIAAVRFPLSIVAVLLVLAAAGPAGAQVTIEGEGDPRVGEVQDIHDAGIAHAGEGLVAGEHAAHAEGLPVQPHVDLALWSGIVFLLFLAALTYLAWKPVTKGLDAREGRIRADINAAEKNRLDTERLMAQHRGEMANAQEQVKEMLAEARRDADVARQNILADAQAAARAERARAASEIERAKEQALAELFDTYNDRVAAATASVLGRGLSSEDQSRLIDEAVADFRGSKA